VPEILRGSATYGEQRANLGARAPVHDELCFQTYFNLGRLCAQAAAPSTAGIGGPPTSAHEVHGWALAEQWLAKALGTWLPCPFLCIPAPFVAPMHHPEASHIPTDASVPQPSLNRCRSHRLDSRSDCVDQNSLDHQSNGVELVWRVSPHTQHSRPSPRQTSADLLSTSLHWHINHPTHRWFLLTAGSCYMLALRQDVRQRRAPSPSHRFRRTQSMRWS
jgi:hypothetical protein